MTLNLCFLSIVSSAADETVLVEVVVAVDRRQRPIDHLHAVRPWRVLRRSGSRRCGDDCRGLAIVSAAAANGYSRLASCDLHADHDDEATKARTRT